VRARSYHTSPGRCKASVLCTSLWMIQANTLFSGCPVVDERGCGKVDKGQVASRASLGKLALSTTTSGRRIHSAACEFRYLQRRMCPLTFCFSGVTDAQFRSQRARVLSCLRLRQGADGCRRCRHGCRQRYRAEPTSTLPAAVGADQHSAQPTGQPTGAALGEEPTLGDNLNMVSPRKTGSSLGRSVFLLSVY
jgi:hypothetical protein